MIQPPESTLPPPRVKSWHHVHNPFLARFPSKSATLINEILQMGQIEVIYAIKNKFTLGNSIFTGFGKAKLGY